MKSTYKILSVNLDGLPFAKNIPVEICSISEEKQFGIEADYNLFDYPHCKRVALASEFLSTNLEMISHRIELLGILEELVVKINYTSPLDVINRLFLKRILQVIAQLQQWHPDIKFIITADENQLKKIKTMIELL